MSPLEVAMSKKPKDKRKPKRTQNPHPDQGHLPSDSGHATGGGGQTRQVQR